jgi:hypothetical protein
VCFGVLGVPADLARTGFLCVKTSAFRSNIELDTHGGGGGRGKDYILKIGHWKFNDDLSVSREV